MSPRCPTAVGARKTASQRSPPPSFLSLFFSFSTPLDRTAQPPPCARTLENSCREDNATVGFLSSLARSDVPPPTTAVDDRRGERTLHRQAASMSAALALALRGILRAPSPRASRRISAPPPISPTSREPPPAAPATSLSASAAPARCRAPGELPTRPPATTATPPHCSICHALCAAARERVDLRVHAAPTEVAT